MKTIEQIKKLKSFLQKNFPNIAAYTMDEFEYECSCYDRLVYDTDNIKVFYYFFSYSQFIEIYGLEEEEFNKLIFRDEFKRSYLKTFRE